MGVFVAAQLLGLDEAEIQALTQKESNIGILRKLILAGTALEQRINQQFDDSDDTATYFDDTYLKPNLPYEAGYITPVKLNLTGQALTEWTKGVSDFKTNAPALYKELTDVIAFLLKLDDDTATKKGCKIRFRFRKHPQRKLEYRIETSPSGRIRAVITIKDPNFTGTGP